MSQTIDNNNTSSNGAPFSSVSDYVHKLGGSKVIESILIANNGIAAVKCIRSIRKWAYEMFGNERAIKFVAMATPEDLRVNAEFIRLADIVEEVPGGSNINNYANVDLIVEIAERRGVQGVWAGWGHASEFPRLPDSLSKTKTQIAFLGPPSSAMRDLGDKIASTLIAQSAEVNCVEWSGQGIRVNYAESGIPDAIYQKACVSTVEEATASIKKIGFPCMIKASEGGGGKGIRKVTNEEELEAAFRQVQGEVPGSPIFIMKMLSHCRHLEVQVLADQHGNAIALYGRDCSIQRRHQKIIEEGPAIIAPESIRIQMEEAATRMARMVGYAGVGTVEYLFSPSANQYYFLELNPRLQVEHPVTELITDVNLPAAQLNVAMGIPLGRIPDIRRFYGEAPFTQTPVSLDTSHRRPPKGHAVAVRITGENPTEGFKPTSGGITELTFRSAPRVWGYFSVGASGGLHEFADSQFGHIFAHGDDREKARRELVVALKELSIRGEISTPITYVSALMESGEFKANDFSTHWLDGLIANATQLEKKPNSWHVVLCGGLYKAYTDCAERHKQFMAYLQRGQIPPKELLKLEDTVDLIYHNTKYTLTLNRTSPQTFSVQLKGKPERLDAFIRPLADGGYLIYLDGASHLCYGTVTVSGIKLLLNGRTCLFTSEYDPTKLRTSTAGKLVRYLVDNGAHIKKGSAYAEMEVMKMYLPLVTPESGRITHLKPEGSVLEPGIVIATLQLDDPSAVVGTQVYEGSLPELQPAYVKGQKPHQLLREAMSSLKGVLQGYYHTNLKGAIDVLLEQLKNPAVPLLEFKDVFSCCAVKLPKQVADGVTAELDKYSKALEANTPAASLPSLGGQIKNVIDTYLASVPLAKQNEFKNVAQALIDLANQYEEGLEIFTQKTIKGFFEEYYSVEKVYQLPRDEVIERERQTHKEDLARVLEFELSHMNRPLKTKMIIALLDRISHGSHLQVQPFHAVLTNLSDLVGTEHHDISLKSRQTLIRYAYPSFSQRRAAMEKELLERNFDAIASRPQSVFDVLSFFLTHESAELRKASLEAYIRRAYRVYEIESLNVAVKDGSTMAEWTYNPPFGVDAHTGSASASMMPMVRAESDDNLAALTASLENDLFSGFAFVFFGEIASKFSAALQTILASTTSPGNAKRSGYYNIFQVVISKDHSKEPWMNTDETISQHFTTFLGQYSEKLRQARVRRVTLLVIEEGKFPSTFTFRERLGYKEHPVYRHIEPPLAFDLELTRLVNYDLRFLPTENKQIHLYYAEEKTSSANRRNRHTCLFARAVIRGGETKLASGPTPSLAADAEEIITEAENVLNAACNALEIAKGDSYRNTWHNHIFMKFVAEVSIDAERLFNVINGMAKKYEKRLGRLQVGQVELLGKIKRPNTPNATTMRFIITNPTTYQFEIDAYLELKDLKTKKVLMTPLSGSGRLDGHENLEPYIPPAAIARKRTLAHANNTSYVYDYLELFEAAVKMEWEKFLAARNRPLNTLPKKLVEATEFVLNSADQLELVKREAGLNDIGMVAWQLKLYTPEYPDGRPIVLIANDISFQSGSFGVREDVIFKKASEFAREKKIPRLYIAANSGARIGLAQEVMKQFRVAWVNPENPQKGFKYLYLTDDEYKVLGPQKSIQAKKLDDGTWMITDIIGAEDGLGVENLRGSGMIAGETSRAYDETFTLSYVTGRSVGIGAYIVRLGQRTIQDKGPIILTGAQALNKVLGRRVYASNHQLGGPQIMYPNGVTHLTVGDTMEGVKQMVHWLSYVPRECGVPLPIVPTVDPVERAIDFTPTKSPYDVRNMLSGHSLDGNWVSGFFDNGSFTEYLGGWAKTVVVGRARLGGIPMGVIAVETRTVYQVKPADPAAADSHEENIPQAGQVWFPDSAYKTAQAIQDFNRGEELPLMIFANWRGFSGGLRDLFQEILKFGSYIVDALRTYRQPIFIYLPPAAELRGGAWVVVDPTINEEMMEMYSDENARGGILEPEGTIEIKYKREEVIATIHRLDEKIQEWDKALIQANKNLKADEAAEIQKKIAAREMELVAVYERVASHFADLHDTPGRMKAKGVIRECVPWKTAREYFYFRVKRRLAQEALKKSIQKAQPGTDSKQALNIIREWLQSSYPERNLVSLWEDDKFIINWLERDHDIIQQSLSNLRSKGITEQVVTLGKMDPQAALAGFAKLLETLTPEQRSSLDLSKLKKVL